ncbi:MAG: TorF family putative porin [Planctomycetota bacterium]|jgi:hypothetical protein
MKEKAILVVTFVLLITVGLSQAQEGDLHGSIGPAYTSKFVWRGFNVFGAKGAIQGSLDLDLYGTGFGANLMGTTPLSGGYVNAERWDYTLYYCNKMFQEETFATDYMVAWRYYNYPDQPSKGSSSWPNANLQELQAVLSWPSLCPAGFVPGYSLVKMWPAEGSSYSGSRSPLDGTASGFIHILMVNYPMTISGLMPETPEQELNWHAELVYNDGVGWAGQNVDNDWSHAVLGVSTDFDLGNSMIITPGVNYQVSMEDTVNDDDQLWITVGAKYKF